MLNPIRKSITLVLAFGLCSGVAGAKTGVVTRTMYETFKKWLKVQEVYQDRDISALSATIDDNFLMRFKDCYEGHYAHLHKLLPFLSTLTDGSINEKGYQLRTPISQVTQQLFIDLYEALELNSIEFVELLRDYGLASRSINHDDVQDGHEATLEKYKILLQLLFSQEDSFQENELLHAVANRLFEYSFSEETFPHYQRLLIDDASAPLVRFLHAIQWYHLVGCGWKHWHRSCLDQLKEEARQGKCIRYIAGGNDLLQLLRNKIYNITVVDPFLPTQDRYYAKNWAWLLRGDQADGGLGDVLKCSFDESNILLKRVAYKEGEPFQAKLSTGKVIELKKIQTIWDVLDAHTQEKLGTVEFQRRFAQQDDFALDSQVALLMSYDEMIYVALPDMLDGWGIDPNVLDRNQKIFIKQLRKPVSKLELQHIRIASLANSTDLKFINFASDPK